MFGIDWAFARVCVSVYIIGFIPLSTPYSIIRTSLCSSTPPLASIYMDPSFSKLFKSPRSTPPLPEGRLDFLKGPRSKPPLQEGRLDTLGKVQGPTPHPSPTVRS